MESAVNLGDPDGLANTSMRRLVVTAREIERESRGLKGREKLEALKLQVIADQTVLDRCRGKPRPTPEGLALPDDYAKAVREANRRAKELESAEGNGDEPDHKI